MQTQVGAKRSTVIWVKMLWYYLVYPSNKHEHEAGQVNKEGEVANDIVNDDGTL